MSRTTRHLAIGASLLCLPVLGAVAQAPRDGQKDFDFEIGTWRTHLLLRAPLDSSARWTEYTGTSIVTKVMGGRANLVELEVAGSSGRIAGLSLRLYNPASGQWSLNFSNIRTGTLARPVFGAFTADGRGEFVGLDEHNGREVLVRFVVTPLSRDSVRFEQSYSGDLGRSWVVNWIATDSR